MLILLKRDQWTTPSVLGDVPSLGLTESYSNLVHILKIMPSILIWYRFQIGILLYFGKWREQNAFFS